MDVGKAPRLIASSQLTRLAPLSSQPIGGPSTPYLTHLVPISSYMTCISSDQTITLLDRSTGSITHSFSGPNITQVKSDPSGSYLLASVNDGTITSFDLRSPTPSLTLTGPRRVPYLSLASRSHLIAAGTELSGVDASIDIFDIRSPSAPMFRYTESHSDNVTALHFHPTRDHVLLTASTDGLACAVDVTMQDENDAVIAVGNTGSSIAKAGWGGPSKYAWADLPTELPEVELQLEEDTRRTGLGTVWVLGDMQTLSVWDADKFAPLQTPLDVRTSTSLSPPWSTDYIIDATADEEGVTLFAGTTQGAFCMIGLQPSAPTWRMNTLFPTGGHQDIVRCVEIVDGKLWSGGEDGRLCVWSMEKEMKETTQQQEPIETIEMTGGGGGGSEGRRGPHSTRNQRWKPYG